MAQAPSGSWGTVRAATADHTITQTQRNEIGLSIRDAGLDVADFDWTEVASDATVRGPGWDRFTVEALVHRPTGYAFVFDLDSSRGHHYAVFQPGPEGPTYTTNAGTWSYEITYVRQWLANVKREHDAPDIWVELLRERQQLVGEEPGPDVDNSPFTAEERRLIDTQLGELKELLISSFDLQAEQIRDLNARVQYLTGATERLGRFDWRGVLTGQLISMVISAVIPQGALSAAAQFLTHAIGHLFGGGPPELLA